MHNFLHYIHRVRRKQLWVYQTHLHFNGANIYSHVNIINQVIDGGVGHLFTLTNCTYSYDDTTNILTATNTTTGLVTNISR